MWHISHLPNIRLKCYTYFLHLQLEMHLALLSLPYSVLKHDIYESSNGRTDGEQEKG